MASNAITSRDVQKAATELAAMRRSLRSWLKYRTLNDAVLAGTAKTKKPIGYGQRVVAMTRDTATELDLATQLHGLLSRVMPGSALPSPTSPNAAVALAQIAITGQAPSSAPEAMGGILSASSASHPWLWPVLIVGGLLIAVTTAIKTVADVAKDKEEKACIEAGACTDFGFWLKVGGVAMLGYVVWRELGIGEIVRSKLHKGRS